MTDDPDWRLEVAFDDPLALPLMQRRIREAGELDQETFTQADGVAALFAYAATREGLERLRAKAGTLLGEEAAAVRMCVSRWDREVDSWRQVDPPLDGKARELDEALARGAARVETRTLPCTVGRFEREIFESLLAECARALGISCACAVTRRGILRHRLAITVKGPTAKLDDFASYMRDQARRSRHVDAGSIPLGL